MVTVNEISGKKIVGLNGDDIGEVKDVEFDISTWKVTHLQIRLSNKASVDLGYKRNIGNLVYITSHTIVMPVEFISAISDVITVNKSLREITEDILSKKT